VELELATDLPVEDELTALVGTLGCRLPMPEREGVVVLRLAVSSAAQTGS
jgi:hypothetical protein